MSQSGAGALAIRAAHCLISRQRFAIRSAVTTTAEVGGVPLQVDVDARQALYDPDTFVLGSSFDVGRASFELDASYSVWSSYDGPYVDVHAALPTSVFDGDLDGAMADVDHVLKLEPRHFGALDGMATILQRTGFAKRALEVYRHALAIYPHQEAVEKIVEKLTLDVEGQGI